MTRTPDVTLISPYPSPGAEIQSGVAAYSRCLAHALAGDGAAVTVVAPGNGVDQDGPVRVERCFSRGRLGALKAAGAAIRSGAPVVHVQHEAFLYGGPDSVPGLLLGLGKLRRAGRGPVVTMHQVVAPATVDRAFTDLHRVRLPASVARASLSALQDSIARLADQVIVHEDAFKRVLPRSVVMPLGTGAFQRGAPTDSPAWERAGYLRGKCGAGPGTLLVLCFGFVAPYKGLEAALEAARMAQSDIRFVVAGAEHPRLAGQGYLRGLQKRYSDVATFTGYVPEPDVGAWFATADAVLLAYPRAFSSSGVLGLAIEHGVAALLSPSLAEIAGFPSDLAVPLDAAGMADRFRRLSRDRAQLSEIADRTRSLGEGRSWSQVARKHLNLYEEVINAQSGARRLPG